MVSRSVILDEQHFRVAQDKARALGTTTDEFVSKLIDTEQTLSELDERHQTAMMHQESGDHQCKSP